MEILGIKFTKKGEWYATEINGIEVKYRCSGDYFAMCYCGNAIKITSREDFKGRLKRILDGKDPRGEYWVHVPRYNSVTGIIEVDRF